MEFSTIYLYRTAISSVCVVYRVNENMDCLIVGIVASVNVVL